MKTFGELTREEKIELVTSWIDGEEIEILAPGVFDTWIYNRVPCWAPCICYRIKPTKPSINWDHVHAYYNWLARDEDGSVALYASKPEKDNRQWQGVDWRDASCFSSYSQGTCDWKESLVERPKK